MKQKDIALIAILAIISGFASFFLSGFLFAAPKDRQQQVEKVDVITSDFNTPDTKYFNTGSINPTQDIQIGPNNNNNPFDDTQQ